MEETGMIVRFGGQKVMTNEDATCNRCQTNLYGKTASDYAEISITFREYGEENEGEIHRTILCKTCFEQPFKTFYRDHIDPNCKHHVTKSDEIDNVATYSDFDVSQSKEKERLSHKYYNHLRNIFLERKSLKK